MKIGITADVHLRTRDEYPGRYNAFIDILVQCRQNGIEHLIIAGDLFDKEMQNYGEFDAICNSKDFEGIKFHIIPGNHDLTVQQGYFGSTNIVIYSEPTWVDFAQGWRFLFIPYDNEKSMGEVIQENIHLKENEKWCLVGHGDWYSGVSLRNPYEPGVYMPITSRDITLYKPDFVFLGHIHLPVDDGKVFYPGSPCGLNITETGYRRFISIDLEKGLTSSHKINTDHIYFCENLIIVPAEDEVEYLQEMIKNSIQSWGLAAVDENKVTLRIKCKGYSTDKSQLLKTISKLYKSFKLESQPDISEVSIANDVDRNYIMKKIGVKLHELGLKGDELNLEVDMVLLDAMKIVYGEG